MGFLAILYKNFLLKKIHKSEFYLENFFFTIYILYLCKWYKLILFSIHIYEIKY